MPGPARCTFGPAWPCPFGHLNFFDPPWPCLAQPAGGLARAQVLLWNIVHIFPCVKWYRNCAAKPFAYLIHLWMQFMLWWISCHNPGVALQVLEDRSTSCVVRHWVMMVLVSRSLPWRLLLKMVSRQLYQNSNQVCGMLSVLVLLHFWWEANIARHYLVFVSVRKFKRHQDFWYWILLQCHMCNNSTNAETKPQL